MLNFADVTKASYFFKFTEHCKALGKSNAEYCAKEILELEKDPKCYDMQSAVELMEMLRENYNELGGGKNISITSSDFKQLKEIKQFELERCIKEILLDFKQSNVAMAYLDWLRMQPVHHNIYCNCISVYGINAIFNEM